MLQSGGNRKDREREKERTLAKIHHPKYTVNSDSIIVYVLKKFRQNRTIILSIDVARLCGLVVRVSGYRSRGPAFDS
jgi:hypothetical protein